ncbi:MAG: FeoB-associated Cys-rich membrane protein [Desulfobacterales bacterium]|jgi:hypothetical protein
MENIIVILLVGLAVAYIGRVYYKKYKKSNQCSCGCNTCPTDANSCEFPDEREKYLRDPNEKLENQQTDSS